MERKNTDQNISLISVRICLNGYRLSFIRDSRHVIAYQYQKSHIRPSVALSLSLFLIYLSSFCSFFPRTIQDSWKAIERNGKNVSLEMIGFTTKILSYLSVHAHVRRTINVPGERIDGKTGAVRRECEKGEVNPNRYVKLENVHNNGTSESISFRSALSRFRKLSFPAEWQFSRISTEPVSAHGYRLSLDNISQTHACHR